jgi:hypothetical protein
MGKALTRRGQGEQQASRAPLYRWADHRAPPPPIAGHRIAGHRIASIIAGVVEVRLHVGVWAWKYGKALDRGESNTGSVVPLSVITGHSTEAHHVGLLFRLNGLQKRHHLHHMDGTTWLCRCSGRVRSGDRPSRQREAPTWKGRRLGEEWNDEAK